jgi:hypothetical protein
VLTKRELTGIKKDAPVKYPSLFSFDRTGAETSRQSGKRY